MSFPSFSSSVASMFSTVQPCALSFCIAAAVTWSFVWLDSMSDTSTWKRLTCRWNRGINRFYLRGLKISTPHLHAQEPPCHSISLLPCYLQAHHDRSSSHEWILTVSSSRQVPSAQFSWEKHVHPSRIPPLTVSSCGCVDTPLKLRFLVAPVPCGGVHDLNKRKHGTTVSTIGKN